MRKLCLLLLVLLLTGCSNGFQTLSTGLDNLKGYSQEELFMALGMPDSKLQIDKDTVVYTWANQRSGTVLMPTTQTTTGYIGTTPITINTYGSQPMNYNYMCIIKYTVKDGMAYSYEFNGDEGGCAPYIQRVSQYKTKGPKLSDMKTKMKYEDCVKQKIPMLIQNTQDLNELSMRAENICRGLSWNYSPNLAKFYAREAIEKHKK